MENKLNEDLLIALWEHILDTMGGRVADLNTARITQTTYYVAVVALFTSVIGIIFTLLP